MQIVQQTVAGSITDKNFAQNYGRQAKRRRIPTQIVVRNVGGVQHLINNQEKTIVSQDKPTQSASLHEKLCILENLTVTNPLQHDIPPLGQELEKMMYWG